MKTKTKLLAAAAVVATGLGVSEFAKASDPSVKAACTDLANGVSVVETNADIYSVGAGGASKYGVSPSKTTCFMANKLG